MAQFRPEAQRLCVCVCARVRTQLGVERAGGPPCGASKLKQVHDPIMAELNRHFEGGPKVSRGFHGGHVLGWRDESPCGGRMRPPVLGTGRDS